MKFIYTIVIAFCLLIQNLSSQEIDLSSIPPNLGANNWGTEFYFSFTPAWEGTPEGKIKIYISSTVRTKVKVEITEKGFETITYTIPNDIIEITLAPLFGQPYRNVDHEIPDPDQVWLGCGIHIVSDDPIICYGVKRYGYTADGFLTLPVNTLGKEYIVASYNDPLDNSSQWLPSYTSITAQDIKTKVRFTMGGNEWSTTSSGQTPGEVSNWNLNADDVLLFGSVGGYSDLTGSKIESTKPVAVVSGSYCPYIPRGCKNCDIIEEMEIPTYAWGTAYHVTPIIKRKKGSILRIFAKEPKTTIYRDGIDCGYIMNPGGVEGIGWFELRASDSEPMPVTISSDKPIGITQYNTGREDDSVMFEPFQMVLVPIEQYQRDIIFSTPGVKLGNQFSNNFVNICFEADSVVNIPDDLEIATLNYHNSVFSWYKLKDTMIIKYETFASKINNKKYAFATVQLSNIGIYKLRSKTPIQVYQYGYSGNHDSYGFPASVQTKRLDKNDTLPPATNWNMDSYGNVTSGEIIDYPDDEDNRANLALMYMHSDKSYNYEFEYDEFIACEERNTNWSLNIINANEEARAVITFADCNGNDSTIVVDYSPTDVEEIVVADGISISPNPVRDYINISHPSLTLPADEEGIRVEIFDVLGRTHTPSYGHPSREGNYRLDVSHLQPGIYFIRVGDEFYKFVKM